MIGVIQGRQTFVACTRQLKVDIQYWIGYWPHEYCQLNAIWIPCKIFISYLVRYVPTELEIGGAYYSRQVILTCVESCLKGKRRSQHDRAVKMLRNACSSPVATMTAQSGFKPLCRHLILKNFSAPMSAPKPAYKPTSNKLAYVAMPNDFSVPACWPSDILCNYIGTKYPFNNDTDA